MSVENKVTDLLAAACPRMDPRDLVQLLDQILEVVEKEMRYACWLERRLLYVRCQTLARSKN